MAAGDTYLNMMPMFHTGGCGLGTLSALVVRGRTILAAQFEPGASNDVIEQERATCFLAVPTMLVAMLEDLEQHPRDHSSVKGVLSGGAMVAPTLVNSGMKQWGCCVQVLYGQTEASPVLTQTWRDDSPTDLSETLLPTVLGRDLFHGPGRLPLYAKAKLGAAR